MQKIDDEKQEKFWVITPLTEFGLLRPLSGMSVE